MNTIQLDQLQSMYDEGFIEGTDCPTCYGEETVACDVCEGSSIFLVDENGKAFPCKICSFGTITCPTCEGEPYFEIYWNTLFEVPSYALSGKDFETQKRIAWENGWLLLEDPNGDFWLAAGSCGYDFTWVRAKTLMLICGFLPWEYIRELSIGGSCFVSDEWKLKIAKEAVEKKCAQALDLVQEATRFRLFIAELTKPKEEEKTE